MPVHERRQYFRIEDRIYFNYRILGSGDACSDSTITNQLLGEQGKKFMEATQYFHDIDAQLTELTQKIALEQPGLAHYLNLLNTKIDYLSCRMLMEDNVGLHKVNISLGGIAFKTPELVKERTYIKIVLYARPKMSPLIIDGQVIYSQYQSERHYRTSIQFNSLTPEQEQLLAQHILLAQVKNKAD
jgi:hypothetical protein